VRGRQGPVQELDLHAVVALSGSLSGAAGRGGPRDRVAAPGSPARDQAQRLAGTRYSRVCGSAPGRGLAAGAKGPNGPPRRDVGPQRPPAPHDKADDTKQPANSGGDQR